MAISTDRLFDSATRGDRDALEQLLARAMVRLTRELRQRCVDVEQWALQ